MATTTIIPQQNLQLIVRLLLHEELFNLFMIVIVFIIDVSGHVFIN